MQLDEVPVTNRRHRHCSMTPWMIERIVSTVRFLFLLFSIHLENHNELTENRNTIQVSININTVKIKPTY